MKKNKNVHAVAMKRKGAEKVRKNLSGKNVQEELHFWKEKTEQLKQAQKSLAKM